MARKRERENNNVGEYKVGKVPRETRVALSLIMLTSSTSANSLNIARSSGSVMCFGTCPTNSFTLSSLDLLSSFPSAITNQSMSFLSLSLRFRFAKLILRSSHPNTGTQMPNFHFDLQFLA